MQVPVEKLEAAVVRHYTSRAGDPHRHLHLHLHHARVFAAGQWRGLHTVGFRDSIEALNGIGHAAVMCDPQFRAALAAAGYRLVPDTGEVAELAPFVGAFSKRAAQIGRNIDRYEADWRTATPARKPGPGVRRSWDRRAWKDARPTRSHPRMAPSSWRPGNQQLRDLGYRDPTTYPGQPGLPMVLGAPGSVRSTATPRRDHPGPAQRPMVGLERHRRRGQAEKGIAGAGVVADHAVRTELAEDLTAARSTPVWRCCTMRVSPSTSEPSPHRTCSGPRPTSRPASRTAPAPPTSPWCPPSSGAARVRA